MNKTTNNFELASRLKFRFPYKGSISVEDLWDLTPEQLDSVYKDLNKAAKVFEEDSLMSTNEPVDYILKAKIEIVKHVFNVKKEEATERRNAAEKAAKKQRILEVLAKKQDDSLNAMSEEDLMKMLNDLDN